jgi:hypothetical protein
VLIGCDLAEIHGANSHRTLTRGFRRSSDAAYDNSKAVCEVSTCQRGARLIVGTGKNHAMRLKDTKQLSNRILH